MSNAKELEKQTVNGAPQRRVTVRHDSADRRGNIRDGREETFFEGEAVTVDAVPLDRSYAVSKRAMDLVLSVAAIVALSLPLLIVAILIKITSRGPVFFSQNRVGLGGAPFKMYKFRTMVVNAEALKASLAQKNELSGPVFKMKNDPRITKIGVFLRRHSIDELPQLWNAARGDMSVVGPRPAVPSEVEKYRRWHARRVSVKPGLTCIWQVSGRNRISFEEWMRMDMRYIERKSLRLDISLIWKTIWVVLTGDGAY
jgi:exopolysaccharide biosynthesis polyprenyl glycosylphosphotransferase